MCSKRIFSNSNIEIDYINYNKIKNGCVILKSIKSENNVAIIDRYNNYNTWQTLNNAYFKYIDNKPSINYLRNIYDSNESFIDKCLVYNQNDICFKDKNILYPYGNIINKKQISPSYSSKIYICKWCNTHAKEQEPVIDEFIKNDKCKQCICKKYKPLFI